MYSELFQPGFQAKYRNPVQREWLGNVNTALQRSEPVFSGEQHKLPGPLCDADQDLLEATLQHQFHGDSPFLFIFF